MVYPIPPSPPRKKGGQLREKKNEWTNKDVYTTFQIKEFDSSFKMLNTWTPKWRDMILFLILFCVGISLLLCVAWRNLKTNIDNIHFNVFPERKFKKRKKKKKNSGQVININLCTCSKLLQIKKSQSEQHYREVLVQELRQRRATNLKP